MITLIVGTNRPFSQSANIAKAYSELLTNRQIEHQTLALETLPKSFIFTESYGLRSAEFALILDQYVEKASAYIFIVPDYNGGFPGVLKSFIDASEPKMWANKKATLVGLSSGRAGALRGLDQLTNVLNYLKVNVFHNKPPMSKIDGLLQEGVLSEEGRQVLEDQWNEAESFMK